MWFKMGMDIFNAAPCREIARPRMRGDNSASRQLAYVYLLSITARGGANDLQDAADLARLVDTTPKQAQIVWDVCIKHGVLRKGEQGYSARQWMIERGILGDRRRKEQPQQAEQPQPTGYHTDGSKTSW